MLSFCGNRTRFFSDLIKYKRTLEFPDYKLMLLIIITHSRTHCVKFPMSPLSSAVVEARSKIKQQLLNADILSAQREYARIYSSTGLSEQLRTVLTQETDLQIVMRRSLGTSTFEDKGDDARDARVAALESEYEQRVWDVSQCV